MSACPTMRSLRALERAACLAAVSLGLSPLISGATGATSTPDTRSAAETETRQEQRRLVFWALNLSDFVPSEQVRQTLDPGVKHPENPVLAPRPGHWDGTRCKVYGTVFYDEQETVFKMWHSGGEDRPEDVRRQHGSPRHVGYAFSEDGVHWTRPNLGIVEVNGSRDNNVVLLGAQAPTVFKRVRETDPEKRYLMFSERGLRTQYTRILVSPDGLRWKELRSDPLHPELVAGQVHEPFSILFDPLEPDPKLRWKGYSLHHVNNKGTYGGRAVGLYTTDDPVHWRRHEHSILDASTGLESEIHIPHVTRFHDDYVMLYDAMEPWHDTQTEIAVSRDGIHFARVQNGVPVVPRGGPGDHDGAKVCVSPRSLFVHEGRIWWYYTTSGNNYQTGPRGGRAEPWYRYTCLAQWREDGFAHLQLGPGAAAGTLETIVCETLDAGPLEARFNVVTPVPVQIELVDSSQAVQASGWIKAGDHLACLPDWTGGAPRLGKGSTWHLRVRFDHAATRLYSIKISSARRAGTLHQSTTSKKVVREPREVRWTFDAGAKISAEPLVHEDSVYVGSWDEHFYAINRHTGQPRWRFATKNAIMAGAAMVGDCVVFGSRDGHVYGLHRDTGKEIWRHHMASTEDAIGSGAGHWVACPPAVGKYRPGRGDRVYVGSHHRRLVAINPGSGKWCWEFPTFNWLLGRPVVADYTVYFGSVDGYLYGVDSAAGALNWRYRVGRELVYAPTVQVGSITTKAITAQPLLHGSRVYIGAHDGFMHAVDAATGRRSWTRNLGRIITARAVLCDGKLIAVTGDGLVACMRPRNGDILWRHDVGGTVHAAPVVHDASSFWVTPVDGNVLRFNGDGRIVERIALDRPVRATPAMTPDGELIVAACTGELFCIRPDPSVELESVK